MGSRFLNIAAAKSSRGAKPASSRRSAAASVSAPARVALTPRIFESAIASAHGPQSGFETAGDVQIQAKAAVVTNEADLDASPAYEASGEPLPEQATLSEAEAERELAAAVLRLQNDKGILSGDPNGLFNYDDPVLAAALICARQSALAEMEVMAAGLPGEELREGVLRWAPTGIRAFFKRNDRSLIDLAAMVPSAPEPLAPEKDVIRLALVGDAGYAGRRSGGCCNRSRRSMHASHSTRSSTSAMSISPPTPRRCSSIFSRRSWP